VTSPLSGRSISRIVRFRPIELQNFPAGARTDLSIPIYFDAMGASVDMPLILLRGRRIRPIVGICAALHGDELNGIKVIHRIISDLDPDKFKGSLLCAPILNVPSYKAGTRRFPEDGKDLNNMFPGKVAGLPSEQYARAIFDTYLKSVDYLIDFHTASEGRRNTFYVRADLTSPATRDLAHLMAPEIILHGKSGDGTLRSAARRRDIPAITVEAGDPDVFQPRMTRSGEWGVRNILHHLGILSAPPEPVDLVRPPVVCHSSTWLRTRIGGLLDTRFALGEFLEKGQRVAEVLDPFGYRIGAYDAPSAGVVIGMSGSPVAVPGTRYCHLGQVGLDPIGKPPTGRVARPLDSLLQEESVDDLGEDK